MKVCILTAGIGSRMGDISQSLNKSILPTNNGAIISEIINYFGKKTKFVIAIGYKKNQVKDYLKIAHPSIKKNITFVNVDNFNKNFSGPGYSLYKCKKHLNEPFYAISCDTLMPRNFKLIHNLNKNILFGKKVEIKNSENYCNFELHKKTIKKIYEKKRYKNKNFRSFSGLVYIFDYKKYWKDLSKVINVKSSPQFSDGLSTILKEKKLFYQNFNWIDVGKFQQYQDYIINSGGYDFSKTNEAIYIINDRVIKFFSDKKIVNQRFKKTKIVKGIFPFLWKLNNFYYYNFVKGKTLYEVKKQTKIFYDFLEWADKNLWIKKKKDKGFKKNCRNFYKDKTYIRLRKILKKHNGIDKLRINNKHIASIKNLLNKLNWNKITKGESYFIHGDLQFDNILYTGSKNFTLLDWRQSFGNYVDKGDIYYDISKLLGGILINYKKIKMNKFYFRESKTNMDFKVLESKKILKNNFLLLHNFILRKKLDLEKIYTLTALIFLNMSPLHHSPFDKILFGFSKELLHDKNYFKKYEPN